MSIVSGPEAVIDLAFHTAREQLPTAQLVYNDYMSWEPQHAKHCDDVLRLLEGFRKRGTPVDALHTSTMLRAVQTAEPLARERGLTPHTRSDLREYDAERSLYVPVARMAQADPAAWERMRAGYLPEHVDGAAFRARVCAGIEEVVAAHPGRATVVVVAHAGVVNAYLAEVLGIGRDLPFPLDYVGISRVVCARDGMRKVRTVNETTHVADLL